MERIPGIILSILIIASFSALRTADAQTTIVYVSPKTTTLDNKIGMEFAVNISISSVVDLASWEFRMYYPSSILNATSIFEGPFLKAMGSTTGVVPLQLGFTDNYNATHGRIWVCCSLLGSGPGATGNGTLATISFKTKRGGIALLHLDFTDLLDSNMPSNRISHADIDGSVLVKVDDVAVTNILPFKAVVGEGFGIRINVTFANLGYWYETFNATLYGNTTTIQTQPIILQYGKSVNVTFNWNTSGFAKGRYQINAYAWPVAGETNVSNNRLYQGWVFVSTVGDVDGNKNVNLIDVFAVALAFGSNRNPIDGKYWRGTKGPWSPNLDLNDDNKINLVDYFATCKNFGKHW